MRYGQAGRHRRRYLHLCRVRRLMAKFGKEIELGAVMVGASDELAHVEL